ncbi:unnamed protein product [Polarella glacialis]|uniref:Uncharacterized protein n=1 Tax=Polarella glacialis TaxID=89957 RepID=A0A813KJ29_POLGL|nr:unnamed protein product [Polarella glacialis]
MGETPELVKSLGRLVISVAAILVSGRRHAALDNRRLRCPSLSLFLLLVVIIATMVCQDLIDQQGVRCFVHTIDMSSTLRTGVRKQTAGCQTLWSGNCGGRRFPNSRRDRVNCGLPATSSTDKNSNKDNNNCDSNGGLPATSSTAHQYDIWEGLFDGIISEESHAYCLRAEHFRYKPILDAQIVKAALDHISIEDLRIIDSWLCLGLLFYFFVVVIIVFT